MHLRFGNQSDPLKRIKAFSFLCTFVPGRERKVHRENFRSCGTFVPCNIRSLELSLPWNFHSSGANVPRTFVPMKLSFHENEYSKNFHSKCPKTRHETGYKPYNSLRTLITIALIFIGHQRMFHRRES